MYEKIKAEIERRLHYHYDKLPDADSPEEDWTHNELCELGAYKELEHLETFIESLEKKQPKKLNVTGDDFSKIEELKNDLEHPEELDKMVAEALRREQPQSGYVSNPCAACVNDKGCVTCEHYNMMETQPGGLDEEDDNLARFTMYWYGDDDSMFLSNVFVGKDMRHHGCGNFILEAADEVANMYNADRIYLKTKKGSFAHKWYKRHGYVDDELDKEDKTMIWMKKEV